MSTYNVKFDGEFASAKHHLDRVGDVDSYRPFAADV